MFKSPVGIAVHPVTRRVYVADTGNHRIQILDENLMKEFYFPMAMCARYNGLQV